MGGMLLTDKLVFRWLEGFGAWSLDSATHTLLLATEVKPGYSASYTYDANGNRLTKTVNGTNESYNYNAVSEVLSHTLDGETTSYGYDAAS